MPSRSIIVVIVVFWLAMTALLVRRDVWPRLAPGEPPPFALNRGDEQQATHLEVRWSATRTPAGKPEQETAYTITTKTIYDPPSDSSTLRAWLKPRQHGSFSFYAIRKVESAYRVTSEGRLLGFEVKVENAAGALNPIGDLRAHFTGEVTDRVCTLRWQREDRTGKASGSEIFGVSRLGNVLLPLHPLYRMTGLTPGRRWGAWLFDPLASVSSGPKLTWVNVRVRPEVETLRRKGSERTCRVVEYEGDGGSVTGVLHVDTANDKLLTVQARPGNATWKIVRE